MPRRSFHMNGTLRVTFLLLCIKVVANFTYEDGEKWGELNAPLFQ